MSKNKKTKSKNKKSKNGKSNCDNVFLSKEDRNVFRKGLNKVNWCDEDSVWDFAIECGRLSVRLRSEVLSRSEDI